MNFGSTCKTFSRYTLCIGYSVDSCGGGSGGCFVAFRYISELTPGKQYIHSCLNRYKSQGMS